jgi:hypothetical protein
MALTPELAGRHPSTVAILRYFEYGHLPTPLADISAQTAQLAGATVAALPDDPELTAGLRKLLEAKDCFVRAALTAAEVPDSYSS